MLDSFLKQYQPNPPQQFLAAFWQACAVRYRINDLKQLRASATSKRLADKNLLNPVSRPNYRKRYATRYR